MENAKFLEMWNEIRSVFDSIIKKYDAIWIKRERKINTRFLILFILRLTIPKDERGYGNTLLEIFNNFFNFGINNFSKSLAPSSICEARMKLNPIIFKELNNEIIDVWNRFNDKPFLWHGLLLRGVDGSKLNLPRELLEAGYETPGDHAHYPQGLLSGVYDLLTGIPLDFDLVSHCNERKCALVHLKQAEQNSVYIYDRGYFSFELLENHVKLEVHAVFRLQSNTGYNEIKDFWESNETDIIVVLHPPKRILENVKKGILDINLESIRVRLIKYKIEEKIYVLLTTLTDQKKYPENIFPEVYHSRWGHEEMLKVSKVITGVKDFHSTSETGIKQELFAHFIIITLLKIVQSQSYYEVKEAKKIKDIEPPKRRIIPLEKKAIDKNSDLFVSPGSLNTYIDSPTSIFQENNLFSVEETHAKDYLEEPKKAKNPPEVLESSIFIKGVSTILKNTSNNVNDIFKNEEIDKIEFIAQSDQSIEPLKSSEELDVKINQRGCFLVVGFVLEKLLFWNPIQFVRDSVRSMVELSKRLYQKVRPGRSSPRTSKSPPSKWAGKRA